MVFLYQANSYLNNLNSFFADQWVYRVLSICFLGLFPLASNAAVLSPVDCPVQVSGGKILADSGMFLH